MGWSARFVAMAVAVAALTAAGSAFAEEANLRFSAKVRIISGGDRMQYHGKVRSDLEACQVGRTVRITESGDLIGLTSTKGSGKFSLKTDAVEDGSTVKFKLKPNGPDCPSKTLFVEI